MGKERCPYCHEISEDDEFCDFCGRSMMASPVEDVLEEDKPYKTKWTESTLKCHCITCNRYEDDFYKNQDYKELSDFMDIPINCEEDEEKITLYFLEKDEIDLDTWLHLKGKVSFEEAVSLVKRISKIISQLNLRGYILGYFDLSDFWMKKDDINTLKFRKVRPLMKKDESFSNYKLGQFYAPEVKNDETGGIGYSSDVFLMGKLLLALILEDKDLNDYGKMRYVSHQLELFTSEFPIEIRYWIGKSTSIFNEERYENVDVQMEALEYLLKRGEERKSNVYTNWELEYAFKSDIGFGKTPKDSKESYEFLNEDSYLYLEGSGDINNSLVIVADGISNCKYGSGYKASNVIIDTATELWNERSKDISDREQVEKFFVDLVKISSAKIVDEAMKDIPLSEENIPEGHILSSDIMGSTLVGALIVNNVAYTLSIGDSRIYLSDKGNSLSLLNIDDNYLNKCLKEKMPMEKIKVLENKSSLMNIIGGANTKEWPFKAVDTKCDIKEVNLLNDEILILCSDGVTDYINPIGHRSDQWNADFRIQEILSEESEKEHCLEKIAGRFIDEANNNGGGDNITIVLVKIISKDK